LRKTGTKGTLGIAVLVSLATALSAQTDTGPRRELEQSLQSRYRVTVIGQGLMGIGGDANSIRRVGGVLVLHRAGLWGSFNRGATASWAIRGDGAELLAGHKDVEFQPGEKFYVSSVSVGSDVVAVGLLATRTVPGSGRTGRLWMTAGFFFDPQVLAQGDVSKVYAALDQWLGEEGGAGATVSKNRNRPATLPETPAQRTELKAGMTRDQLLSALGAPLNEVSFAERTWLTYPGMVALLEENKLVTVDRSMQPPAKVSVRSDPPGADVFLDGKFIGSTPGNLQLAPGTYNLSVRLQGYQEWQRALFVIAGSETGVQAKLEPAAAK